MRLASTEGFFSGRKLQNAIYDWFILSFVLSSSVSRFLLRPRRILLQIAICLGDWVLGGKDDSLESLPLDFIFCPGFCICISGKLPVRSFVARRHYWSRQS